MPAPWTTRVRSHKHNSGRRAPVIIPGPLRADRSAGCDFTTNAERDPRTVGTDRKTARRDGHTGRSAWSTVSFKAGGAVVRTEYWPSSRSAPYRVFALRSI